MAVGETININQIARLNLMHSKGVRYHFYGTLIQEVFSVKTKLGCESPGCYVFFLIFFFFYPSSSQGSCVQRTKDTFNLLLKCLLVEIYADFATRLCKLLTNESSNGLENIV